MHYYLYPKGGNAKYCAWIIDFLKSAGGGGFVDASYSFLDDSDPKISLMANQDEIKQKIECNQAKLCLTSIKYQDILLQNVINANIHQCCDGVKMFADALNVYFKEKLCGKKIIGVVMKNHAIKQKYLGSIESILEQNGFQIVYILTYYNFIHDQIEEYFKQNQKIYIYCDYEVLEKISFIPFVIDQSAGMKFHPDVASLKMVPSMDMYPIMTHEYGQKCYDLFWHQSRYVNVHSQSLYNIVYERQTFGGAFSGVSYKLVKGGYPSIDEQTRDVLDTKCDLDTVVIIGDTLCINSYDKLVELIFELIDNGFRVLYKPTKRHSYNNIEKLRLMFLGKENFVWYEESKLNACELSRSIVALESGISSMAYSYPVLAKKPSILLYFDIHSSDSILQKDTFFNSSLHIRLCQDEIKNLLPILKDLAENKATQQQWKDKIKDYCKNDLYHYGCASEFIAQWICEWYQKREILKDN